MNGPDLAGRPHRCTFARSGKPTAFAAQTAASQLESAGVELRRIAVPEDEHTPAGPARPTRAATTISARPPRPSIAPAAGVLTQTRSQARRAPRAP